MRPARLTSLLVAALALAPACNRARDDSKADAADGEPEEDTSTDETANEPAEISGAFLSVACTSLDAGEGTGSETSTGTSTDDDTDDGAGTLRLTDVEQIGGNEEHRVGCHVADLKKKKKADLTGHVVQWFAEDSAGVKRSEVKNIPDPSGVEDRIFVVPPGLSGKIRFGVIIDEEVHLLSDLIIDVINFFDALRFRGVERTVPSVAKRAPYSPAALIVGGSRWMPPTTTVLDAARLKEDAVGALADARSFSAYEPIGAQTYVSGVAVARCDVDGDGTAEVVTSSGKSQEAGGDQICLDKEATLCMPPMKGTVRVFDESGSAPRLSFIAQEVEPYSGFNVACGDVDGDGKDEILSIRQSGVLWVTGHDGVTGQVEFSFKVTDRVYAGGLRLAAGDVNGDGKDEIVTASGYGTKAQVRVLDAEGNLVGFARPDDLVWDAGIFVAAGDVNGDGYADIVTAKALAHDKPAIVSIIEASTMRSTAEFTPYPDCQGDMTVAVIDMEDDGVGEIVVSPTLCGGKVGVFSAKGTKKAEFTHALDWTLPFWLAGATRY